MHLNTIKAVCFKSTANIMLRGEKHEAFLLNQENNKITVVPIPAPHTVRSFTQNNKTREGDKEDTNRKEKTQKYLYLKIRFCAKRS